MSSRIVHTLILAHRLRLCPGMGFVSLEVGTAAGPGDSSAVRSDTKRASKVKAGSGARVDPSEAWKPGQSLQLGQWIGAASHKHSNWLQLCFASYDLGSLSAWVLFIISKVDVFTVQHYMIDLPFNEMIGRHKKEKERRHSMSWYRKTHWC